MLKKSCIATLMTLSMLTSVCFAQIGGDTGGIVASIKAFNQDFNNKSQDVRYGYYNPTVTNALPPGATPPDSIIFTPYLNNIQTANTATTKDDASKSANTATSNNLANSLTQFNYELHKSKGTSVLTEDPNALKFYALTQVQAGQYKQIPYEQYDNDNSLNSLINGNAASDTLYMQQTKVDQDTRISTQNKPLLKKPEQINNNNFNFSALFEPTSYQIVKGSNGQQQDPQWQAANSYIVFAAQSTKNLAEGLKLNALKEYPAALADLKTDPNYLKYVMTIRSLLAIRSITIDTLEHLITERTPHPKWGKAIGDPNKNDTASPLQVEAYQANHRIEDPNWYNSIMNDAPITIQRTIAIELAEIEHQNYQAHLDRERILAALTASNLESNLASGQTMEVQVNTVNSDIENFIPKKQ